VPLRDALKSRENLPLQREPRTHSARRRGRIERQIRGLSPEERAGEGNGPPGGIFEPRPVGLLVQEEEGEIRWFVLEEPK